MPLAWSPPVFVAYGTRCRTIAKGDAMDGRGVGDQVRCSFCRKRHAQVDRLIAGPGVYICNQCVALCNEIVEENEPGSEAALPLRSVGKPRTAGRSAPGSRPAWVDDHLFPYESNFADIGGHTVHYVDEGDGPVLLMLHGNPSWSFLYRDMIAALRGQFRCVALDYPGFGLSSAAAGYRFTAAEHADVVETFVEHLDLTGVTPVLQDWGGPIGIAAAARHPDRYRAVVVGNTWAWPKSNDRVATVFSAVLGGPVGRYLIERRNLFASQLVPRGHTRRTLTAHEMLHYTAPFPDAASRVPRTCSLPRSPQRRHCCTRPNADSHGCVTCRRRSCGRPRTGHSVNPTDAGGSTCSGTTRPSCCAELDTTSRTTPATRHRGR